MVFLSNLPTCLLYTSVEECLWHVWLIAQFRQCNLNVCCEGLLASQLRVRCEVQDIIRLFAFYISNFTISIHSYELLVNINWVFCTDFLDLNNLNSQIVIAQSQSIFIARIALDSPLVCSISAKVSINTLLWQCELELRLVRDVYKRQPIACVGDAESNKD